MGFIEMLILAVGLSMDAFAVAICTGLTMAKASIRKALAVGLYFGIFQAAMPLIGYLVASLFAERVIVFGDWVAFVVLSFLGGKMIVDSFKKEGCKDRECPPGPCSDRECAGGGKRDSPERSLRITTMLPLAVATSIDALAVGVSFALLQVSIVPAVTLIGITTLAISMAGVKVGNIFGARFKSKAQLAGGAILVLIGLRIILGHLGLIHL